MDRTSKLTIVFNEFDLDCGGTVGRVEMFALGQARRKLGQKSSSWTEQKNNDMLRKMGAEDGEVTEENFVTYFDSSLPQEEGEFQQKITEFLACAWSMAIHAMEANGANAEDRASELEAMQAKAGIDVDMCAVTEMVKTVLLHSEDMVVVEMAPAGPTTEQLAAEKLAAEKLEHDSNFRPMCLAHRGVLRKSIYGWLDLTEDKVQLESVSLFQDKRYNDDKMKAQRIFKKERLGQVA